MLRLRVKVVTGVGNFGQWIERLGSFYEQKTGMRFYPGTLNLELTSEYSLPSDVIRLEADEYGGRVSVSIVPCRIFNRPAFLLRPDRNEKGIGHHPRNIIEIATDFRVRDRYKLRDGDWVEVEFPEGPRTAPRAKNAPYRSGATWLYRRHRVETTAKWRIAGPDVRRCVRRG